MVDNRSLLIRTASGNKLLAAVLQSDVAFEIDWRDDTSAWSVVARGTAASASARTRSTAPTTTRSGRG